MAYSPKADDISFLINDVPELTEDEKITLVTAMKKAQELDAQERNKMRYVIFLFLYFVIVASAYDYSKVVNKILPNNSVAVISRPLEGQLYKYTNVVKGWQYRWFILNPETGILEYYMLDEVSKKRPRGAVYLAGAVISPSDEDGQSFAINAACGEVYKLKANDAKERQFWVNRIRAVAEQHTKNIAEYKFLPSLQISSQHKNPPLPPREHRTPLSAIELRSSGNTDSTWYTSFHSSSIMDSHPTRRKSRKNKLASTSTNTVQTASNVTDALNNVRDMLKQTETFNNCLSKKIEALPHTGTGPKCCDTHLLLLKATSAATLHTLQQCYSVLQHQQVAVNFPRVPIEVKPELEKLILTRRLSEQSNTSQPSRETSINIDPFGEISDSEEPEPKETPIEGDRHAVIMNLLSQVKLGTDLTNVVLPSFLLEPRSLLEMFADSLRYPEFLIKIPDCTTPESRMLAVVQWYLTSFNAARDASMSKKPYNPILGETFRCSLNVHHGEGPENLYKVTYVSEQVSHHPPVSVFYVECSKKKMSMSAHICLKSNFLTSYVAVNFIGEITLDLLTLGESYVFTFPSAYLRCMLTVPWIELGGRISITCAATNYNASVTFQTKPQQSGVPHRVIGEIKQAEDIVYRINGEWNNNIQFISNEGKIESINVAELKRFKKHVRPLDQQDATESRKVWQHVTKALLDEDYDQANFEKYKLEEQQRGDEKKRSESNSEYLGKLFHKENDIWKYKYPLH